jgi:hypothetical protein
MKKWMLPHNYTEWGNHPYFLSHLRWEAIPDRRGWFQVTSQTEDSKEVKMRVHVEEKRE